MKFDKEVLLSKLDSGEYVVHEIVDSGRWTLTYQFVFEHEGKHYETCYTTGATEQQDHPPFEYDDCVGHEVELKEVVTKQWVKVND